MEVARSALGELRGVRGRAVTAWLGVPYALPPVGALRLRAPLPIEPWHGERPAVQFAAAAPQLGSSSPVAEPMVKRVGTSEDCLYLNVWSPSTEGRRPVLVWIHGGGFMMGTGATYDGAELAELGDIVVVTINYRLAALGFVGFGTLFGEVDDNVGLRDQLAALRWVRDHIAAFGGDPERVTVAGESAGSISLSLLMMMKEPLFHGAIAQSGTISLAASAAHAAEVARLYADELRVTSAAQLRELPVERFTEAHEAVMRRTVGTLPSRPYLDGKLLPATPSELFATRAASVPLLLGSNHDEATLFALLRILPVERGELEPMLRARLPAERAERVLAAYGTDRAGGLLLSRDAIFTMPMIHFADRHRVHAPTWMYRFDWPTPAFGGHLGAMHALEVFLMWMDPERRGVQMVLGGPPSAAVRALALRMKQHWVRFVRDGDPGWPRYDAARTTKIFNLEDRLANDPEGARRLAWDGLDDLE